MKNRKLYDFYPETPRYITTLGEEETSRHLYINTYEEVLIGEDAVEECDDNPTFREIFSEMFDDLRRRASKGQWGKISLLCLLLLTFSMLYSGDSKEKLDPHLLLPAYAQDDKNPDKMSDEELERLRFQEELEKKEAERNKEDAEIVKSLQLLKELKERQEALQKREEELQARETQMKTIEEGVNSRIVEMEKLKSDLQELVTLRQDLGERSIRQLVKVYENMKPDEAASVLERLEEDIAVQVLLRMKGKKAGKILNVMKPAISVRLSEEIARRK